MSAVLAIGWQPELRGILITIIAVVTFCGSCYFVLSTNLGARLGFLVAFAALAGWMFLMGATWWSYGKGLLGPDASWAPISGRTVLQTTEAVNDSGALDDPIVVDANADPDHDRRCDRRAVRRPTAGRSSSRRCRRSSRPAPPPACCSRNPARWPTASSRSINVFDKGGQRSPQLFDGKVDFLAFFHKPHYAVVEVAPLVKQRAEPGRAPAQAGDRHQPLPPVRVHDP